MACLAGVAAVCSRGPCGQPRGKPRRWQAAAERRGSAAATLAPATPARGLAAAPPLAVDQPAVALPERRWFPGCRCRRRLCSEGERSPKVVAEPWCPPADPLEAEWRLVERCLCHDELSRLHELRRNVQSRGLDSHMACAYQPHSKRAVTLLRYLRARRGDPEKAAALLQEALDWRKDFQLDEKLSDWRVEWNLGMSRRVRMLQQYDFVALLGEDFDGLPVYVHRFSQGDPAGLARELGEETLFLHLLRVLEDSFSVAQDRMLKSGNLCFQFVEIYDLGDYGLVPSWSHRMLAAAPVLTRFAPILDKIYPKRLRAAFVLRAPMTFSIIWSLVWALLPKSTRARIRICGHKASSWLSEMEKVMPRTTIPSWLRHDCINFADVSPCGGIVPSGLGNALD